MPFPLWELQGLQTAVMEPAKAGEDAAVEKLVLSQPGKLTPAQFQQADARPDRFLEYASEPAALKRHRLRRLGAAVPGVLHLPGLVLKKEYWKDVH